MPFFVTPGGILLIIAILVAVIKLIIAYTNLMTVETRDEKASKRREKNKKKVSLVLAVLGVLALCVTTAKQNREDQLVIIREKHEEESRSQTNKGVDTLNKKADSLGVKVDSVLKALTVNARLLNDLRGDFVRRINFNVVVDSARNARTIETKGLGLTLQHDPLAECQMSFSANPMATFQFRRTGPGSSTLIALWDTILTEDQRGLYRLKLDTIVNRDREMSFNFKLIDRQDSTPIFVPADEFYKRLLDTTIFEVHVYRLNPSISNADSIKDRLLAYFRNIKLIIPLYNKTSSNLEISMSPHQVIINSRRDAVFLSWKPAGAQITINKPPVLITKKKKIPQAVN